MKLDRNATTEGRGKYGLIKLRGLDVQAPHIRAALNTLWEAGALDWGPVGTETEFFVIRLRDVCAQRALHAYAEAADSIDTEYAAEVMALGDRAGPDSPFCKRPD